MSVYETARANMVENQIRPNKVTGERLLDALARTPRELFVPERLRGVAYIDQDLPLGDGRYLMEPMVVARLLQAAGIRREDAALVIGAGPGYEAAVIAMLARSVVALEEDPDLARRGRAALVELRLGSVSFVEAPLAKGHRARAPYDLILFAGAASEIPVEIAAQLAEGGRIAAVLRPDRGVGRGTILTRTEGVAAQRAFFDAATPFLPGFAPKPAFAF